jgi:hypothetical protein
MSRGVRELRTQITVEKLQHTRKANIRLAAYRDGASEGLQLDCTHDNGTYKCASMRGQPVQASAQHGPHRQVRHGTTRLSQHAFGRGSTQAIEKSVRAIGRHHDEI